MESTPPQVASRLTSAISSVPLAAKTNQRRNYVPTFNVAATSRPHTSDEKVADTSPPHFPRTENREGPEQPPNSRNAERRQPNFREPQRTMRRKNVQGQAATRVWTPRITSRQSRDQSSATSKEGWDAAAAFFRNGEDRGG